jgi:hypothetical protein
VDVYRWQSVVFQNNVVYSMHQNETSLIYRSDQSLSNYQYDNNQYYGSGLFTLYPQCDGFPCANGSTLPFSSWQSNTGLDAHSKFTSGAPTGVWSFARPNPFEPGRANVVIYNWDLRSSVQVDLSTAGIKIGDKFQIRDGENWFGGALVSGTYTGAPVTIPMAGLQVALPNGVVPNPQPHTAPQFGVFVVLSGNAMNVF